MASLLWKWQITLGPLYFLGSALQTAWNQIELKEQNSASSAELLARAGICCSARQADPLVGGRFARLASELLFSLYLRLWSCIICSCTSHTKFFSLFIYWKLLGLVAEFLLTESSHLMVIKVALLVIHVHLFFPVKYFHQRHYVMHSH